MALLGFYNYESKIAKSPQTFAHRILLDALKARVRPDDWVVLSGANTVPMYLDRYQKRKYLNLLQFFHQGRREEGGKVSARKTLNRLDAELRTAWRRHRKIYVLRELWDVRSPWAQQVEKLNHLPEGSLREFWAKYPAQEIPYHGNVYFIELKKPVPTPTPAPGEAP